MWSLFSSEVRVSRESQSSEYPYSNRGRELKFTLLNSYVLELLCYGTFTLCDATLSYIYVVICYVLWHAVPIYKTR